MFYNFSLFCVIFTMAVEIKGNAQFIQKETFEPLMDFKQNYYGSWKYYKSCYFYKFSSLKLWKHTITFFCDSALWYFHETNINRWFLGLTQNCELCVSFKLWWTQSNVNEFERKILLLSFCFFFQVISKQVDQIKRASISEKCRFTLKKW